MKAQRPDRFFFFLTVILALAGFIIFSSAALGLLGRDGASFSLVTGKQLVALLLGLAFLLTTSALNYRYWQRWSPYLLVVSLILTLLVFLPPFSLTAGGAKRWLLLPLGSWSFSFQPAELLKLTIIMGWAAWLTKHESMVKTWRFGFLPLLGLLGGVGLILLSQPNTSALVLIAGVTLAMFIIAGGRFSHLLIVGLIALSVLGALAGSRDYVRDRFRTYLDPSLDVTGASYQINQAWIAIGSGGLLGRGFGRSIQKFYNLPEPIGDSIFAVAAEEFGLVGSLSYLLLLLLFSLWGLKIASRAADTFGRLLAAGIVILISSQSLLNIGAMVGLLPLTGVPLIFVSQGGTSLLLALAGAGIVLNVSRYRVSHKN